MELTPKGIDDALKSGRKIKILKNEDAENFVDETLKALLEVTEKIDDYGIKNGEFVWLKPTGKETKIPTPVRLCNFTARIVEQEIHNDGLNQRRFYRIRGVLSNGRPLKELTVPAERFAALNWTSEWGSEVLVYAGITKRDHLRAAIQTFSRKTEEKEIFTCIGWLKIDEKYHYLHGGGAIWEKGIRTDINVVPANGQLAKYILPAPTDGKTLINAIKQSLSFIKIGRPRIGYALLAADYRAPLAEIFPASFSLSLIGRTGTFKTELAALALAHFGAEFNSSNIPASWSSTSNSLEYLAHLVKDAVLPVDDFAPSGSRYDIAKLHRDADRLLRGVGNSSARSRMGSDRSYHAGYTPRGLILSTGEDVAAGPSLRARLCIIEVSKGDVDTDELTRLQAEAAKGTLAESMAGYLHWLSSRMETLRSTLKSEMIEIRKQLASQHQHARTPTNMISLLLGFKTFLKYALEAGAIDQGESDFHLSEGESHLAELFKEHEVNVKAEDPVIKFVGFLRSALIGGKAHISDCRTGREPENPEFWGWRKEPVYSAFEWAPKGTKIGWIDEHEILLEPNLAFSVAQHMASEQGDFLIYKKDTLYHRLKDAGLLSPSKEKDRIQDKRTIEGQQKRVLVLKTKSILVAEAPG